jgi:hypothetical protein
MWCLRYAALNYVATSNISFKEEKISLLLVFDVFSAKTALKVHKREKFFGSDFEFFTIL